MKNKTKTHKVLGKKAKGETFAFGNGKTYQNKITKKEAVSLAKTGLGLKTMDEHSKEFFKNRQIPDTITVTVKNTKPSAPIFFSGFPSPENVMLKDMEETFDLCLATAKKKNADYAGDDAFKNFRGSTFVGVDPARAILVRMMDKMSRVSNLLEKEAQVADESIGDTLLDIANYAVILKSYIKNNPK